MNEAAQFAQSLIAGIISGGASAGAVWWMFSRWMDRVDAKLDKLDACSVSVMREYRTKADALDDSGKQWGKIDDLDRRVTRIEAVCEGRHG